MAAYKGACRLTPVVMTNNPNTKRAPPCRLFMTAARAVGGGLRRQRHLPGISAICSRSPRRRDGGGPAGRSLLFPVSWVIPKGWMKAWTKSGGQIDPIFLGGSCTGSMGGMAHDHGPMTGLEPDWTAWQSHAFPSTIVTMNTTIASAASGQTLDLGICGMSCASCVGRVERALRQVPGVQQASVNLVTESARIAFAAGTDAAGMAALSCRAVRNAGYEPRVAGPQEAPEALSRQAAVPGFLPVGRGLLLSAPLLLPMLGALFDRHWMLPAWAQCALATPGQFLLGARLYKAGWDALKARAGVCRCGCG